MHFSSPVYRILGVLLLGITAVFILIVAKQFLIPIALGILFAFFLYPTAEKLESFGWPRLLVNFILVLSMLIFILGIVFLLSFLLTNFVDDIPQIKLNLLDKFETIKIFLQQHTGIEISQSGFFAQSENALFAFDGKSIQQFFTTTSNTIFAFGVMVVYVFLFLYYRDKFKEFIARLTHHKHQRQMTRVIKEITEVTPQYLTGLLIVVTILAGLNTLGFWIIGLKYPIFFGVLAAILNLIPYLGTIIGYLVVFIFALATQPFSVALGVLILFFIIQFTENNILTPNITGSRVHINPLMTIVALIAAGAIWGFVGMFIILPFLSMFKIAAMHIKPLQPFAFLLGMEGTEQHALTYTKIQRVFGLKR